MEKSVERGRRLLKEEAKAAAVILEHNHKQQVQSSAV